MTQDRDDVQIWEFEAWGEPVAVTRQQVEEDAGSEGYVRLADYDRMRAAQQAEAEPASEAARTAPGSIWLQVGDEEWHSEEPFPDNHGDVSWCDERVFQADVRYVRANLARPAPAPVVPEGYVLVPKEPTQNMVDEAKLVDGRLSVWKWADGYRAMLSAAPQQEDES